MTRPVTAIVTGFTKNSQLPERSLAPLRALKRKGIIRRIVAVTWDKLEIDSFVAPLAAMEDIELIRVPEPEVTGGRFQTGVIYQIRNLEAALARVPEPDSLVVKIRPDFVADVKLLEEKIVNFEQLCAPSKLGKRFGVKMPASPFAMKIWIPWADASMPFFYEDAAFIGLKRDLALLADRKAEAHLAILADKTYGWFAHVVRFAMPFLRAYPIFEPYIRNFNYFPNDMEYRGALLKKMTSDAFYFYLLIVHAWVLATSFHVDCGAQGQISLYANISNPDADWSLLESLAINSPYDQVEAWRETQQPGGIMPCVARIYGRLVDDSWQNALFVEPVLRDLSPDRIRAVLRNAEFYRQGLLADAEAEFLRSLSALHRQHQERQAA